MSDKTPAPTAPETPTTAPETPAQLYETNPWLERLTLDDFLKLRGLGCAPFTHAEAAKLRAAVPDDELDILPTGEVYLHQVGYRQRLLDTFGPGGWGLVALGEPILRDDALIQTWALVVRGAVIATAPGEANYKTDRARAKHWEMSYGTAIESAKSNALMRCCKDIGVAAQNWDRAKADAWRNQYAVHVYRTDRKTNEEYDEWRKLEAGPHWNETGIHPGSPNKAAWRTQVDAASAAGYVRGGRPASSSSKPPMQTELPDEADQRSPQERTQKATTRPAAAAARPAGSGEKPITDKQYGYMKGLLKQNHVEAATLFAWLKHKHQVTVQDGHGIPARLFNECKAFVEAGGEFTTTAREPGQEG